jgi:hypothetical protein
MIRIGLALDCPLDWAFLELGEGSTVDLYLKTERWGVGERGPS